MAKDAGPGEGDDDKEFRRFRVRLQPRRLDHKAFLDALDERARNGVAGEGQEFMIRCMLVGFAVQFGGFANALASYSNNSHHTQTDAPPEMQPPVLSVENAQPTPPAEQPAHREAERLGQGTGIHKLMGLVGSKTAGAGS